ncbi:MAG TPA: hypothetical protein VJ570_11475 [Holophagaceae bacterium]|nr:hypothetical protein [Holophagaceae bacterium]
MFHPARLILPSALLLSLGCVHINDGAPMGTQITVAAKYRDPGTATLKPTRYCWTEVYDLTSGSLADSGYLDANGLGTFVYPEGDSIQVRVYARVEVPDGSGFTLRGSVKPHALAASYATTDAFNAVEDATLTSFPGTGTTLALTAEPDAFQTNQAFNAADQLVAFGQGMKVMQPGFQLPNLHVFFSSTYATTGYPTVVKTAGNQVLQQASGRAIFALPVAGNASGAAGSNNDLGDDAVLLEAYGHLLFADHSLQASGASALSYLRRDNDDQWVDRMYPSEPTIAFATGFGDFLAAACRSLDGAASPQLITDTKVDNGGSAATATFDLSRHDQFSRSPNQGEFYRGSVAISLWQTWQVALGGTPGGLQTLWNATARSQSGEYLNAPLGAYPTYLLGLKNLLGPASAAWTNTLFQLGQEDVQDPSPAYFASGALWTPASALPFATSGSFPTYAAGYSFDRDQASTFTFPGGGNRTVTLSTTAPSLVLEILDSQGWYRGTVATPGSNGTIVLTGLPAGTFAARVRVNPVVAYADGTAPWSLTIQ